MRFFNRPWSKLELWVTTTQQLKHIYSQGFLYKNNYGLSTISEVPLFRVQYSMSKFHITRDLRSDAWLILQWLLTLFSNLPVTEKGIRAFRTTQTNHLYKWLDFFTFPMGVFVKRLKTWKFAIYSCQCWETSPQSYLAILCFTEIKRLESLPSCS